MIAVRWIFGIQAEKVNRWSFFENIKELKGVNVQQGCRNASIVHGLNC